MFFWFPPYFPFSCLSTMERSARTIKLWNQIKKEQLRNNKNQNIFSRSLSILFFFCFCFSLSLGLGQNRLNDYLICLRKRIMRWRGQTRGEKILIYAFVELENFFNIKNRFLSFQIDGRAKADEFFCFLSSPFHHMTFASTIFSGRILEETANFIYLLLPFGNLVFIREKREKNSTSLVNIMMIRVDLYKAWRKGRRRWNLPIWLWCGISSKKWGKFSLISNYFFMLSAPGKKVKWKKG